MGYHIQTRDFGNSPPATYAYDATPIVGIDPQIRAKNRPRVTYDSYIIVNTKHCPIPANKELTTQPQRPSPNYTYHYDCNNKQSHKYTYRTPEQRTRTTDRLKDTSGPHSSSKRSDADTEIYYYGFRYYDPTTGRWPNRDPIEEGGGLNLYGMVGNDAVNLWDLLGLFDLFLHTEGRVGHLGCEVHGTTWDVGRYRGRYKGIGYFLPWGSGPNMLRKSATNPNKSKEGFTSFTFSFGQDVDQAVNGKFQALFYNGKKEFPQEVKDRLPEGKTTIPSDMRYLGEDWTHNTCNCVTETKSNVIAAVREVADELEEGSDEREELECFAFDLLRLSLLSPESYKIYLEDLERKYDSSN